jgi:hypothetical protein
VEIQPAAAEAQGSSQTAQLAAADVQGSSQAAQLALGEPGGMVGEEEVAAESDEAEGEQQEED